MALEGKRINELTEVSKVDISSKLAIDTGGAEALSITLKNLIDSSGVGSVDIATTEKAGIVKPDGTTISVSSDGTISSSGSGFDFEGTKAEFDAAVAAGTITADSVSLITDDVSGANVATKAELQAVDSSKADTSLSNTTPSQSFKEMSVGWGFPDYSTGVQISGSSYTATYKCWLIGNTLVSTLTTQELYVNGHIVGKEEGDYIDVQMPIDVGDVVTVSNGSFNQLFVYAIKGAN